MTIYIHLKSHWGRIPFTMGSNHQITDPRHQIQPSPNFFVAAHFFNTLGVSGKPVSPKRPSSGSWEGYKDSGTCHCCSISKWIHSFSEQNLGENHKLRGGKLGWWQLKDVFIFTPKPWGNDPIWLIFFKMGWFNHQLEKFFCSKCL